MRLTLLIPELLWPEPEDRDTFDRLDCPALCALLARGRLTRRPPQSLEAALAGLFGHGEGAPHGAFRLLGETVRAGDAEKGRWISADPVHLHFHEDRLILAGSGRLDIAREEAEALAAQLNEHFPDLGRFHVAAAERWYLQLADASVFDEFRAPPLSAVAGRSIERLLPEILSDIPLRRLVNEMQMLLHAHPVNRRRDDAGRMTINSLWLAGPGRLPARIESDFDGLWSANPLARGLARAAGVPAHPLPPDAAAFFEHAAPGTQQLVVLEDLLGPVQYENGEAWRQAIAALERRWFAPLRKALASGRIERLRIEATTAYATLTWESGRAGQWKLWRRSRPLSEVARKLAEESMLKY